MSCGRKNKYLIILDNCFPSSSVRLSDRPLHLVLSALTADTAVVLRTVLVVPITRPRRLLADFLARPFARFLSRAACVLCTALTGGRPTCSSRAVTRAGGVVQVERLWRLRLLNMLCVKKVFVHRVIINQPMNIFPYNFPSFHFFKKSRWDITK